MKISGNFRRRSALFMSSTVGLALTLAGCTSVEYSAKGDPSHPKIASAPATPYTATQTANATSTTPDAAAAAGTAAASTQVAANATTNTLPTATALQGGRVALPPASEIAAAAAIDTQLQPQAATTQVALAAPAAATPATTAVMHQANTAALPQVVALKGSFPPAPGAPGTPSAAAIPLTEDMMKQQSVIPVPKPQGAMLAYASAPQNAALAAISTREGLTPSLDAPSLAGRQKLSGLISKYATMYNVPEDLVHRVVMRESRYNPKAVNGGHFGLMQIKHATARSMGFDGPASGLFDAETNLKYAVKYLSGAWLVADNDRDNAVRLYARGYYYDAKRKGMLHVLRK
ncbi:lytic transglycosylase domain-containing protein [Agrobacterium rubi]|uniref:Lytic transglycosylase domain-containing protein n=1 Tax=Agrobacterium rubi TaxID=28099 RepID=A0AAE7UM20_9HYPH|nr:lytic transglycosylase domain-containing protein [Agrobacterium rubi]NTE86837.1 lytic transglycosylase domain-containing protein [Agrobacterium rubi]NTF02771.1 lytic transglycosylase domain-containing protein [Agrobacterium rubi]NTF37015.1 lytic transglycosylase domain-containing protein [Agrobacterium rubi]OCJ55388.1 lytic transglycosylase [Agrobacterium rubi]QTF99452.1 lytic transglycosylase domain-containing protein [Agrobacterium rubi]